MSLRATVLAAMLCVTSSGAAQTAAQHVAAGDKETAERNLPAALQHYQEAVAADSNDVDALWKASNAAVDLGEFSDTARTLLYALGETLARRAVKVDPRSSFAHYALAKALGRAAQSKGTMERIKYGTAVHDEAHEAIRLDSTNAGAWHVLGMWNAEIMRLSGLARFAAKNLLGGKVMGEANWENAQRYLERSVALDPNRITHRLDLASVYADREYRTLAREEYQRVISMPETDYDDRFFKQIAERRLKDLK